MRILLVGDDPAVREEPCAFVELRELDHRTADDVKAAIGAFDAEVVPPLLTGHTDLAGHERRAPRKGLEMLIAPLDPYRLPSPLQRFQSASP